MESIQALAQEIKEELFSSVDLYPLVSPSAYDTAWLAMIPNPHNHDHPLFHKCVDWILQNQREDGFWGEPNHGNVPTLECLTATLACMVALKKWKVGSTNIERGLEFIHGSIEKLLNKKGGRYPRWFAIVFPAMVELAHATALDVFPNELVEVVSNIFHERQRILEMEEHLDSTYYPPLLSYMEALPSNYNVSQEQILQHQSEDGSLFQSPSATAHAFMATGNKDCMVYLESVVQRCSKNGVPSMYPLDEELIKLLIVDKLERLGLEEFFSEEIEEILAELYRSWKIKDSEIKQEGGAHIIPQQLYKDSLAFCLFRIHGYQVSPRRFCQFLQEKDIIAHMEENYEYFSHALLNIHRAAELMFVGENELEEARSFARKLLERGYVENTTPKNGIAMFDHGKEIEHELKLPWLARLDHLEHRVSIEGTQNDYMWVGKASYPRLLCLNSTKLLQLAKQNYALRQSIFVKELEELTSWSTESGLRDIGFGREKTKYLYFAIAANAYLPSLSDIRLTTAKSAILITVIDDYFDMEGSLDELNILTEAVKRWDGEGLCGHNKVLFDALNDLVDDIAIKALRQQGRNVKRYIQDLWYETFMSWIKEAEWSRMRFAPSIDDYIETAMTSIAVHTITLPAFYLLSSGLSERLMGRLRTEKITKLLMVSTRLLNDIQSYEKEQTDGKMNLVLLYMKENPGASIEDSIACIQQMLDKKKKELLELILVDDDCYLSKARKLLLLSSLKVFQMFFNSSNGFDSPTEMLGSINKAIYDPLQTQSSLLQDNGQAYHGEKKKQPITFLKAQIQANSQDFDCTKSTAKRFAGSNAKARYKISHSMPQIQQYSGLKPFRTTSLNHGCPISLKFPLRSYTRVPMPQTLGKSLLW